MAPPGDGNVVIHFSEILAGIIVGIAKKLFPADDHLQGKRSMAILLGAAYTAIETHAYFNFRCFLASVKAFSDRSERACGSFERLSYMLDATDPDKHGSRALRAYSAKSFRRYLSDAGDDPAELSWKHYFTLCLSGFGLSNESQLSDDRIKMLLHITDNMCRQERGEVPRPPTLDPTEIRRLGISLRQADLPDGRIVFQRIAIRASFKPLPVRLGIRCFLRGLDVARRALGYRRHWVPIPEGYISFLVRLGPSGSHSPLLFCHGIGLGALPHLHFFERFRDRTLILVELPNSGHWHYQQENASSSSLRLAVRELFTALGMPKVSTLDAAGLPAEGFRFDVMAHSLGCDFASMAFLNRSHQQADLAPRHVVLLDPIGFPSQILWSHRAPFWSLGEVRARMPSLPLPLQFALLHWVLRDVHTQQACFRTLSCQSILLGGEKCGSGRPTLVCLGLRDEVIPAPDIEGYLRAHCPEIEVFVEPSAEHGTFLKAPPWDWRVGRLVGRIKGFLASGDGETEGCSHLGGSSRSRTGGLEA